MNNHIYRHGLMAKKSSDGRRWLYFYREPPRPRSPYDWNKTAVYRNLPQTGCCGFNHMPYNSKLEFLDQSTSNEVGFEVWTTVNHVRVAAELCEFCRILWLGLQKYRRYWVAKMIEYNYGYYLAEHGNEYAEELYYARIFDIEAQEDFLAAHPAELSKVIFKLSSKKNDKSLEVRLLLEPRESNTYARMHRVMVLDYHTVEGHPSKWTVFGPALQVCADVLSDESVQKISGWIDDCVENHAPCNAISKKVQPARLLHVEPTSNPTKATVRLRLTDPRKRYKFVALSHCWANSKPVKTMSQNLQERLHDIAWDELPKAFQDTIQLSLRLGINYIWIDSLCIIQGDEADWLEESPKMGAIYTNAHIVFAAHGPDLRFSKEINRCTEQEDQTNISLGADANVLVRSTIDHENLVNPPDNTDSYFGRAWCFQERLFASRILHFGGSWEEIWFECNVLFDCECGGVKNLKQFKHNNANSAWDHQKTRFSKTLEEVKTLDSFEGAEKVWRLYLSLCETFSSQGLSNAQDTFLSLSSLADRVSPYLGRYFAGLWEHNILISLQWESFDGQASHRHNSYIAPSFSWTSRTGAAVWYISDEYLTPNNQKCEYAHILDVHCDTSPGAPFGLVTSGYIKLRGYTIAMQFEDINGCYSLGRLGIIRPRGLLSSEENIPAGSDNRKSASKGPNTSNGISEAGEEPSKAKRKPHFRSLLRKLSRKTPTEANRIGDEPKNGQEEELVVCMDTVEDILEARGKTVTCLDIMRDKGKEVYGYISALILLPVDGQPGTYRRVGFSTMTKDSFQDAELKDVIIV